MEFIPNWFCPERDGDPQNGNFDEVSCLWAKRKMDMGTGIPHAEGLSLGEIWRYHWPCSWFHAFFRFNPGIMIPTNMCQGWNMLKYAEATQWHDERHVYFQGPEICTHCGMFMNLETSWFMSEHIPQYTLLNKVCKNLGQLRPHLENDDYLMGIQPSPATMYHHVSIFVRVIESLWGWNVIPMMALFFHETAPKSIERAPKTW